MMKFDDHTIEHWAEIYRANPSLARRGIRFDAFITAPEDILYAHVYCNVAGEPETDYLPLNAAQREVALRVAQVEQFNAVAEHYARRLQAGELRGNRYIEPLHHHAHNVNRAPRKLREGGVL